MHMVAVFKALGDPVRLRLFALLLKQKDLCLSSDSSTADAPKYSFPTWAYDRHAGLVFARRKGKWMYYHLAEQAPDLLVELVLNWLRLQQLHYSDLNQARLWQLLSAFWSRCR